jgi:hypothetical protein
VGVAQPFAIFAEAGAREWAVVQGIRLKLLYGFTGRLDGGVPALGTVAMDSSGNL